ncbi:MAG: adenosylcobinamide-phosphate synthase CbiB [Thermodesulfobacteriota bacterium]
MSTMIDILGGGQFPPAVIIFAYLLDLAVGDPEGLPHPVRWIGRLVSGLERALRGAARTPALARLCGAVLAVVTVGVVYGAAFFALELARRYSAPAFYVVCAYIIWTSIAVTSLKGEAASVVRALKGNGGRGLFEARRALSRIVGRDTASLTEHEVLKAAVETVSENTSDGVVAPLFYLALGGPALMIAYKAVNTLDSMVGYRNERYRDFGWFSARLDDAANYVPSRLAAMLMVCASFILRYNWRRSLAVVARDGRNHPSPNSGFPEAAVAGALGIRLGGGARYGGVWSGKAYIGDGGDAGGAGGAGEAAIGPGAVASSVRIMQASALLMVALTVLARVFVS